MSAPAPEEVTTPGAAPRAASFREVFAVREFRPLFGTSFLSRLVTQMYFPNDPLFPHDPIFNSIPDEPARQRLISRFDLDLTEPEWALGYRFDIVLRGRESTPFEQRA